MGSGSQKDRCGAHREVYWYYRPISMQCRRLAGVLESFKEAIEVTLKGLAGIK